MRGKTKALAIVLVTSTFLPAVAMASEATPRGHCLQKIAQRERLVLNAVARTSGNSATRVMVSVPTFQLDASGYFSSSLFEFGTRTMTIAVPSEREVMARELRVLDWHKAECARLPASGSLAWHTKVGRGGGTRKLRIVQP